MEWFYCIGVLTTSIIAGFFLSVPGFLFFFILGFVVENRHKKRIKKDLDQAVLLATIRSLKND